MITEIASFDVAKVTLALAALCQKATSSYQPDLPKPCAHTSEDKLGSQNYEFV